MLKLHWFTARIKCTTYSTNYLSLNIRQYQYDTKLTCNVPISPRVNGINREAKRLFLTRVYCWAWVVVVVVGANVSPSVQCSWWTGRVPRCKCVGRVDNVSRAVTAASSDCTQTRRDVANQTSVSLSAELSLRGPPQSRARAMEYVAGWNGMYATTPRSDESPCHETDACKSPATASQPPTRSQHQHR